MPKLPRVSGAEAQRALERLGSSSFDKTEVMWYERDANGCVVPMQAEQKVGTLAGLPRQAGFTLEDFIEALKR